MTHKPARFVRMKAPLTGTVTSIVAFHHKYPGVYEFTVSVEEGIGTAKATLKSVSFVMDPDGFLLAVKRLVEELKK